MFLHSSTQRLIFQFSVYSMEQPKHLSSSFHSLTWNLCFSTLGKIFSRWYFSYFSYFSQKTGFDILCKLSPIKTICMKCQILFSGENKKTIINLSSAELAQRMVKVKNWSWHQHQGGGSQVEKLFVFYGYIEEEWDNELLSVSEFKTKNEQLSELNNCI